VEDLFFHRRFEREGKKRARQSFSALKKGSPNCWPWEASAGAINTGQGVDATIYNFSLKNFLKEVVSGSRFRCSSLIALERPRYRGLYRFSVKTLDVMRHDQDGSLGKKVRTFSFHFFPSLNEFTTV